MTKVTYLPRLNFEAQEIAEELKEIWLEKRDSQIDSHNQWWEDELEWLFYENYMNSIEISQSMQKLVKDKL